MDTPETLTCDACRAPAAELTRCLWDARLMVGPCCEQYEENRCPDCGSDQLEYQGHGAEEDLDHYSATCLDCGMHTDDVEGDLVRIKIGPQHPLQPALLPEMERKPARKEVSTVPALVGYGSNLHPVFAEIANGLFVRTAPRKKGGR